MEEKKQNEIVVSDKKEQNKSKKLFNISKTQQIIILSILGLILVIALAFSLADRIIKDYETPINKYYTSLESADVDKMLESYPKELREAKKEYLTDIITLLRKISNDTYTVKHKIIKSEELEETKIKELEKNFKDEYNYNANIKKAYIVKVESTIEYGDTKSVTTTEITVVRISMTWYIGK